MLPDFDVIVIGAGFYGLTVAERVANVLRRFTTLTNYRHRVLTVHNGQIYTGSRT